MKSKKKHTNLDFEVVDGIGKYMDDDIQRIIEGKQLELGDRELPPFDEYRIYKNIQEAVMREEKRKNRRIRMPLFFKWTVACAIVLLVIGVGYNFYQSHILGKHLKRGFLVFCYLKISLSFQRNIPVVFCKLFRIGQFRIGI